jgi:hypothetical protein
LLLLVALREQHGALHLRIEGVLLLHLAELAAMNLWKCTPLRRYRADSPWARSEGATDLQLNPTAETWNCGKIAGRKRRSKKNVRTHAIFEHIFPLLRSPNHGTLRTTPHCEALSHSELKLRQAEGFTTNMIEAHAHTGMEGTS